MTSAAQSAASSPPTPCRISTITSFESAGIRLDERELQLLLDARDLGLVLGRHLRELRVRPRRGEIRDGRAPPLGELVRRSRAPSGGGRPRPPRGGRCRPRGRLGDPASRGSCARARRAAARWRFRLPRAHSAAKRASRVSSTFPLSALETGQPSFAASAAALNDASSMPGTWPTTVSAAFVMPVPGTNVTVADVSSLLGRVARLREPVRQRHREAGGVCRGDQLLGARLAAVVVLRARGPRHLKRAEGAARHLVDLAAPRHQISLPRHLRTALGHVTPPVLRRSTPWRSP